MVRIQIVGLASGDRTPFDGQWIKSYDPNYVWPDGYDGGLLVTTNNPEEAIGFSDGVEAAQFWQTVAPAPYDVRPDGKPNRPLTAFTVEIRQ